jgi:hypothetical protein
MHQFDQDTLLASDEPCSFSGHITENWSINGVPDGGYLMAILAKAMMHQSEMRETPIITANYLSRCEPGEARIVIEKMAGSKQFERFQDKSLNTEPTRNNSKRSLCLCLLYRLNIYFLWHSHYDRKAIHLIYCRHFARDKLIKEILKEMKGYVKRHQNTL